MSPVLHYRFCAQHILIRIRKIGRKEGEKKARKNKGKEKRWEKPFDAAHEEKTTTHEQEREREKTKANNANQMESDTTQCPTRGGKHQWW